MDTGLLIASMNVIDRWVSRREGRRERDGEGDGGGERWGGKRWVEREISTKVRATENPCPSPMHFINRIY